jgi:hypothetical protein
MTTRKVQQTKVEHERSLKPTPCETERPNRTRMDGVARTTMIHKWWHVKNLADSMATELSHDGESSRVSLRLNERADRLEWHTGPAQSDRTIQAGTGGREKLRGEWISLTGDELRTPRTKRRSEQKHRVS